ncbi:MAG: DUF4180 domain-containing protein [Aristaeellaceae bacterium]
MHLDTITLNDTRIALVTAGEQVITDVPSALDLAMTVRYTAGADRLLISKELVADDFFVLRTGLAGEILQKYINYHVKAAFVGDFSGYTSKALRDFIRESNKGRDFFFLSDREEALRRLASAD